MGKVCKVVPGMGHLQHLGNNDKSRATDISNNEQFTTLPGVDIQERQLFK